MVPVAELAAKERFGCCVRWLVRSLVVSHSCTVGPDVAADDDAGSAKASVTSAAARTAATADLAVGVAIVFPSDETACDLHRWASVRLAQRVFVSAMAKDQGMVQCWLAPPLQVHRSTGAPSAVLA